MDNNFLYGLFHCKMDGRNNDWYIKNDIPKRLYIDTAKVEPCCFIHDRISGYCSSCLKEYKQLNKRGIV
jgi:hypothetical protein